MALFSLFNHARWIDAFTECPKLTTKNFVVFLFDDLSRNFYELDVNFSARENLADIRRILIISDFWKFVDIVHILLFIKWKCKYNMSLGLQQSEHPMNSLFVIRDVFK